jgi:hypothetical protein
VKEEECAGTPNEICLDATVRYRDSIQCAAARVVEALRRIHGGHFDALHVRRGDFARVYPQSVVSSTELVAAVRPLIPDRSTVYVATNEVDTSYFDALQQHYHVVFLRDFEDALNPPGATPVHPKYHPMIDQLVVRVENPVP